MKNYYLKLVLLKLREYDLVDCFDDEEQLNIWLGKMRNKHIYNFLSLNGDKDKIKKMFDLVTNIELMGRDDYLDKINALLKVDNAKGWYHLFKNLSNLNFWNSDKFYSDVEMMAKAPTAQYVLWVLGEDDFINSPYHDEDLRLIVETRDKDTKNPCDFVYWDALATVARNENSINSPYHKEDMRLISEADSSALQMSGSYPESGINALACNPVSLNDPYHLENMKLLASHPENGSLLYELMTDKTIIKGKYYREEINAIANAKDYDHALSLYYLIKNPNEKYNHSNSFTYNFGRSDKFSYFDYDIIKDKSLKCSETQYESVKEQDEEYLKKLEYLSKVPDNIAVFVCSLLMNKEFMRSENRQFDLNTLSSIDISNEEGIELFKNVYGIILNDVFMNSKYHKEDLVSYINCPVEYRNYLMNYIIMVSETDLYHDYDVQYICSVCLDDLSRDVSHTVRNCLYTVDGKKNEKHIEILEQSKNNIQTQLKSSLEMYVDSILNSIKDEEDIVSEEIIKDPVFEEIKPDNKESKIKSLFKRKR